MPNRKACSFSGKVQGVGFRYTVKNLAIRYNVQGYVKNLADGRVELVMEGPDDQVAYLFADVSQKMTGYIQDVEQKQSPATGEFGELSSASRYADMDCFIF